MQRGRTVGDYINRLLVKIRPHALDLVDAFGYGPEHLRAAIATGRGEGTPGRGPGLLPGQRASGTGPRGREGPARPHGPGTPSPHAG